MTTLPAVPHLDHAVAVRAAESEWACGDRALVAPTLHGAVVAVIDGLGHGPDAAIVAQRAATVIADTPDGTPSELLDRCDTALRGTRGAAISLATVHVSGRLHWGGIGNVSGRVVPSGATRSTGLVTATGIVGWRLPRVRDHTAHLADGDLMVLFTDGIEDSAIADLSVSRDPRTLADVLLKRHAIGTDDACVLVLRYKANSR